jgi:hypothetical protein
MDHIGETPLHRLKRVGLQDAKYAVQTALIQEAWAVRSARDSGMTWQDIGAVYGITKQSAQQRWPTPGK